MDIDTPVPNESNAPAVPERIIRHRHRTPTLRQIKAIQLMNQGYSKRRAMIEAGYSVHSANVHPHEVTRSRAALEIFDSMKDALINSKLNGEYMAAKIKRWLEAKKSDPDDYQTQIAAGRLYRDIVEPKQVSPSNLKRKVTYEEFLGIEDKKDGNKL
jgi:hypothetical protein